MWPFKKKKVSSRLTPSVWHYLGNMQIPWADTGPDTVHFYAQGDNLEKRKVEVSGRYTKDNSNYQRCVVPWLEGDPLVSPIHTPSKWFKEWCRENKSWEWDGKWWKSMPPKEDFEAIKTARATLEKIGIYSEDGSLTSEYSGKKQ